jgi:hypothetical protein
MRIIMIPSRIGQTVCRLAWFMLRVRACVYIQLGFTLCYRQLMVHSYNQLGIQWMRDYTIDRSGIPLDHSGA